MDDIYRLILSLCHDFAVQWNQQSSTHDHSTSLTTSSTHSSFLVSLTRPSSRYQPVSVFVEHHNKEFTYLLTYLLAYILIILIVLASLLPVFLHSPRLVPVTYSLIFCSLDSSISPSPITLSVFDYKLPV